MAGLPGARIFASGGLDEYAIAGLVAQQAPIDAYGVGTKMGVSADAPFLDSAYKLVTYAGRPVMKLSSGKAPRPAPSRSTADRMAMSSRGHPHPPMQGDDEPVGRLFSDLHHGFPLAEIPQADPPAFAAALPVASWHQPPARRHAHLAGTVPAACVTRWLVNQPIASSATCSGAPGSSNRRVAPGMTATEAT